MSSKDDRPRTIPKFGSFKPKEAVKSETERRSNADAELTSDEPRMKDGRRYKSSRQDGDRHDNRSYHERRSERPSQKYPDRVSGREEAKDDCNRGSREVRAPEQLRKVDNTSNELFTVDKRGDPLIWRYRSNDRSRVPVYRRLRRKIILGSNGTFEIQDDGPREVFSIRTTNEGRSAFRDKNVLALAGKTNSRLFKKSDRQPLLATDQDFIALEPPKKRRRGDEEDDSSSERERKSYRSIEGKAKPHEDSDSVFDSDSDDVAVEGHYITPTKMRAIELTRMVKERPGDIPAWLELIGLQEVLFEEDQEDDHIRTRDEVRALADIKVSMYEKALPFAGSDETREKLLVALMREGSRVWRPQLLAKRWVDVIQRNTDSFTLWKAHMDFELTNISTFSFDEVKQRFVERLRFIEGNLLSAVNEATQRNLAEQAICVFLRLTCFLHEAGFLDLAVGAWQAMLELVFARAVLPDGSRDAAMASLGEYWDSEVPRLGETGAMGWRKFVESGSMGDTPEAKPREQKQSPQTRDLYKTWAASERQQALEARLPAKTVDDGTEDDPFRVVMYSDIEPLLVSFPSTVLQHVRKPLVDAYLLFCHLPPTSDSVHGSHILASALEDPFIYGGSQDFQRTIAQPAESIELVSERKRHPPNFRQDGGSMAISPAVLFPGQNWFSYLPKWTELYPQRDEPVARSYILTTLRQLVHTFAFEDLAEYYLALEWINDAAGAKKVAKTVLKQYPTNVGLYNAYALTEYANGNIDVSRKVLQSAIGIASGPIAQALVNTGVWIGLEATQQMKALSHLCVSGTAETETITPALLLKTRSELVSNRDSFLSARKPDQALPYAISLVLLSYLSSTDGETGGSEPRSAEQGNITSAMTTCGAFSSELTSRGLQSSSVHELFLQFAARLVYYHATHGPFRPVYIREHLQQYVVLFPKNTVFLGIFAWVESSLRIDDPVKALLQNTSLAEAHDCLSTRVFAIRYELQVGNAHSVKGAFEAALGSEACKGNAWLWRCYIRFCSSRRELRSKAKDVFYRAVAACPGSKGLYMEAFTTLRRDMADSDLEAVISTISSKGLRIHVDFDGFAKAWRGSR